MLTGEMCQALAIPTASSISSFVWQVIFYLWPWKWLLILLALVVWLIYELATKNGTAHYNSVNGFSPGFNSFVGSGMYWGIQAVILLSFERILGESVYCTPLPYVVHVSILVLVYLFLHKIGFWPEFRLFKNKGGGCRKHRKRKY
jgi:Fe2+ transport system protein B